jgi:hypothetical protein
MEENVNTKEKSLSLCSKIRPNCYLKAGTLVKVPVGYRVYSVAHLPSVPHYTPNTQQAVAVT